MKRTLFAAFVALITTSTFGAAADEPSGDRAVRVHLSADQPGAELQRYAATVDIPVVNAAGGYVSSAEQDMYVPVCSAPCDVAVDTRATYRIGGPKLHPTEPFRLIAGGDNNIDAELASRSSRTAGRTLTILSVPFTVLGSAIFLAGVASEDKVDCDGCVNMHRTGMLWGGIVGGAGLAMLTTGIILWASSTSSATINGRTVAVNLPGNLRLGVDGLHF